MRTRLIACTTYAVVAASILFFSAAAASAEVKVMISGGFSAAYLDLVPVFERASGHSVTTARGGSMGTAPTSIPSRLQRGEPVDVFIMVGDALEELAKQGKVAAATRVDLARSSIGMAVRTGLPKPDISSVDAFKRAMLEAKSIAYSSSASGVYLSTELFPRLGIADQVKGKSKMIGAAAAAQGEADVALQQVSELLPVAGLDFVGPLPAEIQKITVFSAGIAAGAANPDAGKLLIQFLASPQAAAAIAKSALEPMSAR